MPWRSGAVVLLHPEARDRVPRWETEAAHDHRPRQDFSVCRVYKKTKTLRSFDRRPMGEIIRSSHIVQQNAMPDDHPHPQEMTSSRLERASSSPDSSCASGDHGTIPSQAGGLGSGTDTEMLPGESELFLQDWEQFWP
ncbi:hypothetical protein NL676_016581 [Syzygium grande]|nr:hypothetical protein NL676_016581 [Syzygium grande]